jgi:hypothetical protein
MAMKENLNTYFSEAREYVEDMLGIKLELDELFELRKDVEFTYNLYINDIKKFVKGNPELDDYVIRPGCEASVLFMNRNYGTQIEDFYEGIGRLSFDRTELKMKLGFDYYPEYFKRVQEEMHFP